MTDAQLPFNNPRYWRGAYKTRVALFLQDDCPITEQGMIVAAEIEAGLRARRQLRQIPAWHSWRRLGDQFADLRAVRQAA